MFPVLERKMLFSARFTVLKRAISRVTILAKHCTDNRVFIYSSITKVHKCLQCLPSPQKLGMTQFYK